MIENGMTLGDYYDEPNVPDPVCPVCGHEGPEYIYVQDDVAIGCDHCVDCKDADDWAYEQWERDVEAQREHQEELNRGDY